MDRIEKIEKLLEQLTHELNALKAEIKHKKDNDYNIFVIVDAGHGATHPVTGKYMTPPHIGKFYQFTDASGNVELEIREGDINRAIANQFCEYLEIEGIAHEKVYHDYIDVSLAERVMKANAIHKREKGKKDTILLSFHSNAFSSGYKGPGTSAKGWEVYTTRGNTSSDKFADIWYQTTRELLGNQIVYRTDGSDGDFDREANFYILYHTMMPAVLVENLFFTNRDDARLLLDKNYQKQSALAAFNAIKRYATVPV